MAIPIVVAADENFAVGAGVVMQSTLENTSARVHFYLFHDALSADSRDRFQRITAAAGNAELTLVDAGRALARLPKPLRAGAYTRMTYARLLAPQYVDADRAIYLDADTLVRDDVQKLFDYDLGGHALAATPDYGAVWLSLHNRVERDYFRRITEGRGVGSYFNAGVLLLDLEALRREGQMDRAVELIAKGRELRFADQCALNLAVAGGFSPLEERWNVNVAHRELPDDPLTDAPLRARVAAAFAEPAVVHYVGPKPWSLFPTHFKREYAEVLRRTPWRDYRQPLGSLSWKTQQALLKAWRKQAVSLRIEKNELRLRLFGRPIVQWTRPTTDAA